MNPLSRSRSIAALVGLLLGGHVASADLALSSITLANSGLPAVTVRLNGASRHVLPSPFLVSDPSTPPSAQWFCLDPLQTIYYAGSGEPAGNALTFASTDPADFDRWGTNAPGLTVTRVQNLADLFQAYLPVANTSLALGALQLAVWEIANEGQANAFTLAGGFLKITSYHGNAANTMIAAANTLLSSLDDVGVMNLGRTDTLDFLIDGSYQRHGSQHRTVVQDLVGFAPVPEPATYGLAGAGLLLMTSGLRRVRSRLNRVSAKA